MSLTAKSGIQSALKILFEYDKNGAKKVEPLEEVIAVSPPL